MTAESSALGPMQQLLIGQHQRHHGLHDGYAANADAGIVTALGDDFAGITLSCHGADRDQYGTGRFEGHAQLDGLPRRNAARDPSGMIGRENRSEEHTSELQSLMRISYAVFCLKKKK